MAPDADITGSISVEVNFGVGEARFRPGVRQAPHHGQPRSGREAPVLNPRLPLRVRFSLVF